MIAISAVIAEIPSLEIVELTGWIERHWVIPETSEDGDYLFQEIDVARVRLIYDLRYMFEVEEDTMPVLLGLLDQVYELRSRMKSLMRAVDTQPEPVRQAILVALGGA
jgi:chaperone modulatory protein CbpM